MTSPRNKPRKQMLGRRFGLLTVIKIARQSSWGDWRYSCRCECGRYVEVGGSNLRKGAVQSCGCLRFKFIKQGTRFGELSVIRKHRKDPQGCIMYLCRCTCGNTKSIRGYSLQRGDSKSCGCKRGQHLLKHGLSRTTAYSRVKNNRRYAAKLNAKGTHTAEQVLLLLEKQDNRCFYCKTELKKWHQEHKVPLCRGGSDDISNIVISCPTCNLKKNTMTAEEFLRRKTNETNHW